MRSSRVIREVGAIDIVGVGAIDSVVAVNSTSGVMLTVASGWDSSVAVIFVGKDEVMLGVRIATGVLVDWVGLHPYSDINPARVIADQITGMGFPLVQTRFRFIF